MRATRSLAPVVGLLRDKLASAYSTLATIRSEAMEAMSKTTRLTYAPHLVSSGEAALLEEIHKTKPNVLVVGADKISSDTLKKWREIFSQRTADGKYKQQLTIIRRGTSIAAIDVHEASKLGIEVLNTPNVNSVEVAKSTYDLLCGPEAEGSTMSNLGLIGFGHIGRKMAKRALEDGVRVCAYSPMLYAAYQQNKKEFGGIDLSCIDVAGSIEEVIEVSDKLAVVATLGQYGKGNVISSDALDLLRDESAIVCISEPEVFSKSGLRKLAEASCTKNVRVVFDNAAYMMKRLEKEILEEAGGKKENFTFQSKVMSSLECQRDMDIAATALMLKNALGKKLPEIYRDLRECQFQIDSGGHKVKIVGAGISSMIAALYFQENGYAVEIFEKDSKENPQGITRRAVDARHLSYSETVTHATSKRIEDWLFANVTNSGGLFEKLFAEQFRVIGNNEPLVLLLQSVVADINKTAIKGEFGWQYLRDKYPDIFSKNVFGSGKILRIFSSEEELRKAYKFQDSIHDRDDEVRIVAGEELAEKVPALKHLIDAGKIAGGVEVSGYGVRVIALCDAIENHLFEQSGVRIGWGQEVRKEGEKFFVRDQSGDKRELSDKEPLIISSGVSPVIEEDRDVQRVYGLFISIPNCGLTEALKVHEKDPLGVINITPSEDGKLHISAGFQYFGSQEAREEDLKNLFKKLEEKIAEMFPQSYAKAIADGELERRFCPRPMTSHGLPKFTKFDGGISFGGTNSGGTVEATILGQLALLQTQHDEKLFKKNSELDEAIESILQVTRNCLGYIGSAIKMKPANTVSEVKIEPILRSDSAALDNRL